MIGRIVRSADFERVLGTPTRARSVHFALHHLPGPPSLPAKPAPRASRDKLSTCDEAAVKASVDDSIAADRPTPAAGLWLGAVVPKRHARRSVTRSLLKRQVRAVAARHAALLSPGLWIVRLRAPFDPARFPSAASSALQRAARAELESVFAGALRRSAAA